MEDTGYLDDQKHHFYLKNNFIVILFYKVHKTIITFEKIINILKFKNIQGNELFLK